MAKENIHSLCSHELGACKNDRECNTSCTSRYPSGFGGFCDYQTSPPTCTCHYKRGNNIVSPESKVVKDKEPYRNCTQCLSGCGMDCPEWCCNLSCMATFHEGVGFCDYSLGFGLCVCKYVCGEKP
ncbi:hypothetical protein NMG60_11024174 [Bertholletia excelsa]